MQSNQNLLDLISIFWKWRKSILIVTVLAAILSAIICMFLPNYYKATTVFYPASGDLSSPQPLGYVDKNVRYFGNDKDRDRVFTISQSTHLADEIINTYNLIQHYQIDTTSHKWKHQIRSTFSSYYNIIKTKYDAIELSFEDTDPVLAANIANSIRDLIGQNNSNLTKGSQQNQLNTFDESIKKKEAFLQAMNDSIIQLRSKYGIFDLKTQSEILVNQVTDLETRLLLTNSKLNALTGKTAYRDSIPYYKANKSGLEKQVNQLKNKLSNFNIGYSEIFNLNNEITQVSSQLSIDKERVKQIQSSFNQNTLSLHVIQQAEVPVIKSKPRRSLYVLASALFAFGISCLFILILYSYRSVAWGEILKNE